MLYYKTIDPKTLELLKKLQQNNLFKDLRLVGGTALALLIGHRISIDIDLFGRIDNDKFEINSNLKKIGLLKTIHHTENIHIYSLDGIKTDIVNYPYPWLDNKISKDNITLASTKDIAAMKLSAIAGRGSKKDFIDIYYLLKIYTLGEMLQFYESKYDDGSKFMVLKSLAYFNDADEDLMPKMFADIDWKSIKQFIKKRLNDYLLNSTE